MRLTVAIVFCATLVAAGPQRLDDAHSHGVGAKVSGRPQSLTGFFWSAFRAQYPHAAVGRAGHSSPPFLLPSRGQHELCPRL